MEQLICENKQKELEEWTSCPSYTLPKFLECLHRVHRSGGWHRLNCGGGIAKEDSKVGLRQLTLNPQNILPSQYNLNELIER